MNLRSALMGVLLAVPCAAYARDGGQWEETPPEVRAWYARQQMPDFPPTSCCGEADAYWTDKQEIETGPDGSTQVYAIITDDRDDVLLNRPHVEVGTRIRIPKQKIVDPRHLGAGLDVRPDPNPTGHGIVFLGTGNIVYCYYNPDGAI